ncbi:MAG: hypothetical protein ACRDQZ_18345, partial [Mycobacteriales bacterium]
IGDSIRIEVDYETNDPETRFNLTVYRDVTALTGLIQKAELEVHKDFSTDPNAGRYVVTVLESESRLISASFSGAPPATAAFSLSGAFGFGATAEADLLTQIDNAINAVIGATPGTTAGRFEISVDGQPYVPFALTPGVALANIGVAISSAIAPL